VCISGDPDAYIDLKFGFLIKIQISTPTLAPLLAKTPISTAAPTEWAEPVQYMRLMRVRLKGRFLNWI
jgi:hypothetical protein